MKYSTLKALLTTDIRIILRGISFALCPPRACWPTGSHPRPLRESDAYSLWSASVLWGNSVFWNPIWSHILAPEDDGAQEETPRIGAGAQSTAREACDDHAMGHG